jgi:hypothetical protein
MTPLPNPWISDSASFADTPVAQNVAPLPCAIGELVSEPAHGSLQNSRAETAAGGLVQTTPAAFSNEFVPNFDQMFDSIMHDFHPRDLDRDPPPKFLKNPSPEYLSALMPPLRIITC